MRPLFILFALLALLAAAWGQSGPPSMGQQLSVTISFKKQVVGLDYNATTHLQEGVFAVSADGGGVTAGCTRKYAWTCTPQGSLTFDDPKAALRSSYMATGAPPSEGR